MQTAFNSAWLLQNTNPLRQDLERIRHYLENPADVSPRQPHAFSPSYPLDRLCQRFGLSAFERDVLLLCLGYEIEPAFARLFAQGHQDAQKDYPTLAFCLAVLPEPSWSILSPQSPLHAWQLIELSASYPVST
ncbi:MAG: ATP-binding protein, partial [Kamptonema sp. SIO4C4]|nr:ATP-binding protein [Kamptonema sp. SIO4C4]